jgi:drug/metabolite transporter (DMT)-like permease
MTSGHYQHSMETDTLLTPTPYDNEDPAPPSRAEMATGGLGPIAEHGQHFFESPRDFTNDFFDGAQEAVGNLSEAVKDVAGYVRDGFADEAQLVADVFVGDLDEADHGDLYFLDMSLVRGLSVLPQDIEDVAAMSNLASPSVLPQDEKEALPIRKQELAEQDATKPQQPPLSAYLLLATAVISLSSIGPMLALQKDVTPTMKIYWRMAGTALVLVPFACVNFYHNGFPRLTPVQWTNFLLSTLFFDISCLCFVLALQYTSVGNAVILTNSQALILLVGKIFVGAPISIFEGSGAITASLGAVLCSKDSSEASPQGGNKAFLGDALSLLSALGGVGYLVFAKITRPHMHLSVFMFLTMAVGCMMILVFQLLILGEEVSFGLDRQHGIWGFLNLDRDRLPLEFTMVVVCNLLGTMGYVRAMQFFENMVISTAGLMEPVVAEAMAFAFGVGFLPHWKGWLGNAMVACGTFAVVYPSSQSKGASTGWHSE